MTFARIKQATTPLDTAGFVFAVLTIDQRGIFSPEGKPLHANAQQAYRALGKKSEIFLKRLRRWLQGRAARKAGMTVRQWRKLHPQPPIGNKWVAVVEAHRSGWPHLNLILWDRGLADAIEEMTERKARLLQRWRNGRPCTPRERVLLAGRVRAIAMAAGWGPQSTIERARDIDALNGYVTKLAGMADAASGEIAKITQAPLIAPERFRRLRSGSKFLPPRHKNAEWTGTLVRRQLSQVDGTPEAIPLHDVPPAQVPDAALCCYIEEGELQREAETAARAGKRRKRGFGKRVAGASVVVYAQAYAQQKTGAARAAPPGTPDRSSAPIRIVRGPRTSTQRGFADDFRSSA